LFGLSGEPSKNQGCFGIGDPVDMAEGLKKVHRVPIVAAPFPSRLRSGPMRRVPMRTGCYKSFWYSIV
jgi:hypothetical protein